MSINCAKNGIYTFDRDLIISGSDGTVSATCTKGYAVSIGDALLKITGLKTPITFATGTGNKAILYGSDIVKYDPDVYEVTGSPNTERVVYSLIVPVDDRLCRIEITTPPSKTVYQVGEYFDASNMVVTAYYHDDTSAVITDYEITDLRAFTATDMDVTISYTEDGITREVKQAVRIDQGLPTDLYSIVIATPPNKTSYAEGDNFDPTGMVVYALYAKTITDYTLSPILNLQQTDTDVTVSYTENDVTKTAKQPITVSDVYRIILGADQVIPKSAKSALFSSNAEFGKFVRVEVDGKEVSGKYYTAKSGSTVITFNKAYISGLKEGEHTLRIVSNDGSASTRFTVISSPPTGDDMNPALLMTLLLASMGMIMLIAARARKRNEG